MSANLASQDAESYVSFIVPKHLVKRLKTALEKHGRGDPSRKITAYLTGSGKCVLPSTFIFDDEGSAVSQFIQTEGVAGDVEMFADHKKPGSDASTVDLPKAYSIYGQMLLLPPQTLQSQLWKTLNDEREKDALFQEICRRFKVSHIAVNAPIPLHNTDPGRGNVEDDENVLRSPTNLVSLFGDFGPICNSDKPCAADFYAAFWCHTKQNGITQCWAPRYTMFSRGNITEKARVMNLSSVAAAVSDSSTSGCSAVDLYAGIGYFTFSYLAAGVSRVLGWDINPWSIEGLRRGAIANKWGVGVYQAETRTEDVVLDDQTRLVAFVESNELALARIEKLRSKLPPIRHVNCGLLPTSKSSYQTAAAALDPRLGGWVHVHENFAVAEIDTQAEVVREHFQRLIDTLDAGQQLPLTTTTRSRREVAVEHIQRVKSYAPGVFHCVIDIFVPPMTESRVL